MSEADSFPPHSFPHILLPVFKRKTYLSLFPNYDTLPWGFKKNLSIPKRQRHYKPEVSFCVFLSNIHGFQGQSYVLEMDILAYV